MLYFAVFVVTLLVAADVADLASRRAERRRA
jgi:hypothetical protein